MDRTTVYKDSLEISNRGPKVQTTKANEGTKVKSINESTKAAVTTAVAKVKAEAKAKYNEATYQDVALCIDASANAFLAGLNAENKVRAEACAKVSMYGDPFIRSGGSPYLMDRCLSASESEISKMNACFRGSELNLTAVQKRLLELAMSHEALKEAHRILRIENANMRDEIRESRGLNNKR